MEKRVTQRERIEALEARVAALEARELARPLLEPVWPAPVPWPWGPLGPQWGYNA